MKKLILILAVIATACFAQANPPAAPAAVPAEPAAAPADPVASITKERDEAKAQLAAAQQQQQQQAVVTEYYKVVAERNEALLRLSQANGQIAGLQDELAKAKAHAAPAPDKK